MSNFISRSNDNERAIRARICVVCLQNCQPPTCRARADHDDLPALVVAVDVGDARRRRRGRRGTAAAEERPQALIDQLAVGGILIVPVGRDPTSQVVERIVKTDSGLQRDTLMPVRFVPLVTGALPVLGQG